MYSCCLFDERGFTFNLSFVIAHGPLTKIFKYLSILAASGGKGYDLQIFPRLFFHDSTVFVILIIHLRNVFPTGPVQSNI